MTGQAKIFHLSSRSRESNESLFVARSHQFCVTLEHMSEVTRGTKKLVAKTDRMVLLPDTDARVIWVSIDGTRVVTTLPSRSVSIVPAGDLTVTANGNGRIIQLFSSMPLGFEKKKIFDAPSDYGSESLKPNVNCYKQKTPGIKTYCVDELPNSPGMPRAKLIQSENMSINWVEYEGSRSRENLSPHHHDDFEQGSLALAGNFIHHFRYPWGRNANSWQDDEHLQAGPNSIGIIPPGVVHTTEGVGGEHHLLIDIFSPPRQDFIESGKVLNSDDFNYSIGEALS